MIIHRDCFVRLAYWLQMASGEYIRGSAEQPEELTFVVGYRELLPALENQLLGMRPGEERRFIIPAAEAFGLRDPWLVQEWDRKRFPYHVDLQPGQAVVPYPCAIPVEYPYKIVEVKGEVVIVDQNHPLAGEDLHYRVKILEVRPATPPELAPLQQCEACAGELESCET
ncbi:FKBP-type peptidyl-prolyl cis-trans isomerase [Desulfobacca acetoxidans]|nr:peptidylprolyl isomerase [Desulfobacterales bacterium]